MPPCRIAVIGLGEIGLNRHLPVIAAHPGFEIVASAKRHPVATAIGGVQYRDYREMLASEPAIEAVAICTPPDVRGRIALDVIAAGKHVLLEKPPFSTLGAFRQVRLAAERAGVTLLGGWHSQFNLAVERARDFLADQQVASLEMVWNEDVAVYHPDQEWIWQAGGFGVFDAGVNGISILTRILPDPLVVRAATLRIPDGAQTPIAVEIDFAGLREEDRLHAGMDWRTPTAERTIAIVTRSGHHLRMPNSGRRLEIDGTVLVDEANLEYPHIYDRFAELIAGGKSQLDEWPLVVVADAYLIGRTLPADAQGVPGVRTGG
jgi:D-galactose 1-dehydrogenase